MTNEQFMAALKSYIQSQKLSQSSLARQIGRPRETVQDWVTRGLSIDSRREEIVAQYPHIFSQIGASTDSNSPEINIKLIISIELAKVHIAELSKILRSLVFDLTGSEREVFRTRLGESWNDFLNLTRAMTGETALQVTLREGGLDKWK